MRFDFDEYVCFGAKEVSKSPYAHQKDDFSSNANSCFSNAFIINRLAAAEDLAKRYPAFQELFNRILDNQRNLTKEKLFNECQLTTFIANKYRENGRYPESIFILLAAYAAFRTKGSKDLLSLDINKMIIARLRESDVVTSGWEAFLIAVSLWFFNESNYRVEVVSKYQELNNQTNTSTPDYVEKIDIDLFALIGAKLYVQYDGEPDVRFVSMILQFKLPLAEKIAKAHPSFMPTYEFMRDNYEKADLSLDFNKIFETPELFFEIDCAILMAAIGTFLDQNNPDRSTSNNCIICVERALNKPGAEITGMPSIALLCAALWFSDYKSYKERIYAHMKKLAAEGWYSEAQFSINLDEVQESIRKAKMY